MILVTNTVSPVRVGSTYRLTWLTSDLTLYDVVLMNITAKQADTYVQDLMNQKDVIMAMLEETIVCAH